MTFLRLHISTITPSISFTSMADQTSSWERILSRLTRLLAKKIYLILLDDFVEKISFGNQFERSAIENKTTICRDIKYMKMARGSLENQLERAESNYLLESPYPRLIFETSSSERRFIYTGCLSEEENKYMKNNIHDSMAEGSLENQFEKDGRWRLPSLLEEKVTIRDILLDKMYGTKEDVENDAWDGKMTSQVQEFIFCNLNSCNLNKYVELDEFFNLEEHKKAVQRFSSSFSALDIANYYRTQKYEDRKGLAMVKKYGTKKDVENDDWDGKKTSKLQFKTTGCNLNKYEEPFSQDKRKETVQRVVSCLIATIVFLWFTFVTYNRSSITPVQRLHKQHSPVFIWSSLLEPFCLMVLVWAIATSIVVGASFTRMQSSMLMFWAILMLIKSAKSITEVYVPILGILFTGCYMLAEKQPELPN